MALDGIVIANIVHDLKTISIGARIDKIYQPEKDELIINLRSLGKNYKLLLSANPSNPRAHFTEKTKENPQNAPVFCMLLRKHIQGKIVDINQPNFERIIEISIESLNEMGDLQTKRLIIEIMGKHSNIILVNNQNIILDAIKHISHNQSSVREILPGRLYRAPRSKTSFLNLTEKILNEHLNNNPDKPISQTLYKTFTGISPLMANEVLARANLDPNMLADSLNCYASLYNEFNTIKTNIEKNIFSPNIIYQNNMPLDFSSITMDIYNHLNKKYFDNISLLLDHYYEERDAAYRAASKTADIRKIVANHIERAIKKQEKFDKTLKQIENKDLLKTYGELITSNVHIVPQGATNFITANFYEEDMANIEIPLDPTLTPIQNAQKYFKQYNKQKRSFIAINEQKINNEKDIAYLDSVHTFLSKNLSESEIEEIREELITQGILKKKTQNKQKKVIKPKPMHYKSIDGLDIYIGKNNNQNDNLTMQFAKDHDIWLHTKDIPGSHVIIKTDGQAVPDSTLNQAVMLAAFYSKASTSSLVPVDYTKKKHVRKPSGAKPGMVIYDSHKTAYITPTKESIDTIERII